MILPDILAPNLCIVFCGTAASAASAQRGAYYAGPGNKFWPTLHGAGLTPELLRPADYPRLPEFRLGLTDLVKHNSGSDASLRNGDFDVRAFTRKIAHFAPLIVAFNGKRAAQTALRLKSVGCGAHPARIATSRVWVLPSTSGAANAYWDSSSWHDLAAEVVQTSK